MKMYEKGAYLVNGTTIVPMEDKAKLQSLGFAGEQAEKAWQGTISYQILKAHNISNNMENLQIKFDSLTSHDLTYVGIIQTAKASGLDKFPLPYILTNCHNTLCAVGGTINEDDHVFGLSAAKKYGGIYLPPHLGVIHQYMRECWAGCGRMILGSDSHTRYGALGTLAIGEGGGELVKQILSQTYDIAYPEIVGVFLTGKPGHGVGPHDVNIAIITAVFKNNFVKNRIMEFVGPGVTGMSTDFRNGVDVMTTETTCLSSVWQTDEDTKKYLTEHRRGQEYKELRPQTLTYYDRLIEVNLSEIKPMIALPFHPSNGYTIADLKANPKDILHEVEESVQKLISSEVKLDLLSKVENGKIKVDQGIIAGCAGGTFTNLMEAAHILQGASTGKDEFALSVYPSSQPVMMELLRQNAITTLLSAGATVRTAFCGPCFGAGDTPANGGLSVRHTTRNFPNREGSKPGKGQLAAVALMDARSIAATAAAGGVLTGADEIDYEYTCPEYHYDPKPYEERVYNGFNEAKTAEKLIYGPNIKDWPEMPALNKHMLLKVAAFITDDVTTTDELIPSGETASFRSNPMGLAEFTLSRRVPEYVGKAKAINQIAVANRTGKEPQELQAVLQKIKALADFATVKNTEIDLSSVVYATKPGDGSAREQAASCQRVLGGGANIAKEYATKRYRSNLINWGMIPFTIEQVPDFADDAYIFVPNIKTKIQEDEPTIEAYVIGDKVQKISLKVGALTAEEKDIISAGSLINYNRRAK